MLSLKIDKTIKAYNKSAKLAAIPNLPYKTLIKIIIVISPKKPAKKLFVKDSSPRVGPIVFCSRTDRDTGRAPAFSCVASSLACSVVNHPVICPLSRIACWTVGAEKHC